jgi:hypothetical protein
MGLSRFSEYLHASRTDYSVPRSLSGVRPCGSAPEVFRLTRFPAHSRRRFILPQTSTPLQRPNGCRSSPNHPQASNCARSSSLEVLRPSSDKSYASRTQGYESLRSAIPPRPFSDPRGLDPHVTARPCFMPMPLMGFLLFRAFPHHRPRPSSSPGDTLPTFGRASRKKSGRAPRAF